MNGSGKTVCFLGLSAMLLVYFAGLGRGISNVPNQDFMVKAKEKTKLEPVPIRRQSRGAWGMPRFYPVWPVGT